MIVDILAYRYWAIELATLVKETFDGEHDIHIHTQQEDYCLEADLTFLVGWSDIVPIEFYKDRTVLVLHPSPLPKYRGGSPIQNQIMAGETKSAVSLFLLKENHPEVDSGPIHSQHPYSLAGDLQVILDRISVSGQILVEQAIKDYTNDELFTIRQDEKEATTFKRRKPSESEIVEFPTALDVYNKIRALQDPYPNAFIRCEDGSIVYITGARLDD